MAKKKKPTEETVEPVQATAVPEVEAPTPQTVDNMAGSETVCADENEKDPNDVTQCDAEDGHCWKNPPFTVSQLALDMQAETVGWGLQMFNIPNIWLVTEGEGVKVGIADTGISLQHTDLKGAILAAKDFTGSPSGPSDQNGHGTHVAGIVAARRDGRGMIGVAPKASLVIAKVLGDNGSGDGRMVANGIKWLADQGCDVINMSLGSPYPDQQIYAAVKYAISKGCFICCAAGNSGPYLDSVGYPAKWPETLSVGSIDRNKSISQFSSRGDRVDICAPGEQIYSCYPPNAYAKLSGTSMADPFVTGVVALMIARNRKGPEKYPLKTQKDLLAVLRKNAIDMGEAGKDPNYGYGLINPEALLPAVAPGTGDGQVGGGTFLELFKEDFNEPALAKISTFVGTGTGIEAATSDGRKIIVRL